MRLISLRFRHIGPFGAAGVSLNDLAPGLNVISETNEFGKSTILEALALLLFKPFSSSDKYVKLLASAGSSFGPMGEISFESGGQTYRLTKQFLKGKKCELHDSAGQLIAINREADEKLAQLLSADGQGTGPSGLLWVRQGASMERVDDDGQVASRLEGELTTLVGGDRARDYLARVETELAENITKGGREKSGGPLKLARDALAQTELDLGEAISKCQRTYEIGQALSGVNDDIARLESSYNPVESQAEILATREELTKAAAHEADLKRLVAEQARAKEIADRATEKRDAHIEAMTRHNRWTEEVRALEARKIEQTEKLTTQSEKRQALRNEIKELEQAAAILMASEKAAEEASMLKVRFEAAAQEAKHMSELNEAYESLSARLEKLNQQLADLPAMQRADLADLQNLFEDARQAEANISALTTRLYLNLSKDGAGKASIGGVALSSGSLELAGDQVLKLDGIGELRSDDSQLKHLEAQRKASQAALAHQLDQLGVADLTEARQAADQRHEIEVEQKQIVKDMNMLAPQGAASLQHRFEAARSLAETLSDRLDQSDVDGETSTQSGDDLRQDLNTARGTLDATEEILTQIREESAKLSANLSALKTNLLGLSLASESSARLAAADQHVAAKLEADSALRLAITALEAARAEAPTQSLDMLKSRLDRLELVDRQSRENLEGLKRKAASLRANRDAAFEGEDADARVQILKDRREVQFETLKGLEHVVAAQTLLRDTLKASQARLRDAYTEPVRAELAPLLARVIPGAEAHLNESLGADKVSRGGRIEEIAQLSGGTREQIAILTRLAFARLLKRSGADAPVILDDALVYADDKRRDDMFDVLNHVSTGEDGLQLIYLSCHQGATQRLGGHRVIPKSWPEG